MKTDPNLHSRRLFVFSGRECPEDQMIGAIMQKISERRLARARTAVAIHGALILIMAAVFVPALEQTISHASASGFFEYVSLAFSDGGSVLSSWKDFAFTMAESIPAIEVAGVIAVVLLFAYSSKKMAEDLSRLRLYAA